MVSLININQYSTDGIRSYMDYGGIQLLNKLQVQVLFSTLTEKFLLHKTVFFKNMILGVKVIALFVHGPQQNMQHGGMNKDKWLINGH